MRKRAAGYIRVSRLKSDDAVSPENQKEKILQWAQLMDIEEVDFYIDLDYSGKNTERPEFKKMMKNLDRYSHVVVYKLSRFSRSTVDFHANIVILENAGVGLVSVSENIDTSTPVGRLIRNVLVDFSQFEREVIAEQVKDNMYKNAGNGNWNGGNAPYGFNWSKKDKQLVANEKMENIRHIFETVAAGYGANTVRNYFYERGIKSPTGQPKWSKNSILGIVRNPVYIGKLFYGGEVHEGKHQGCIDEGLFEKANKMLAVRSENAPRTIGSQHLLSGLIKCECGRNLNIRYNGRSHNLVRRYVCPARNDYTGTRCESLIVDADSIEAAVVVELLRLADSPEGVDKSVQEYIAATQEDMPDLVSQKKLLQKQLNQLKAEEQAMFRLFRKKKITEIQLEEQNADLLTERKGLQKQVESIETQEASLQTVSQGAADTKEILRLFKTTWGSAYVQEKKEILRNVLKKIEVKDDGVLLDCEYFPVFIKCKEKTKTTLCF